MRSALTLAVCPGLVALVACQSPARARSEVAGGETSEFSGGDVPLGYCPELLSSVLLEPASPDVARWAELATGHHELPLRWQRAFPDDRVRGVEERTFVLLDVTLVAARDVECGPGPAGSYETSGLEGWQRRFELAVSLATADGAVQVSFQREFFPLTSDGERQLLGGERLPLEQIGGNLELGLEPGLDVESLMFSVNLTFGERSLAGAMGPVVSLRGPTLGDDEPRWSPVSALFPAPDPGCQLGTLVSLDEPSDVLGDTPRGAYDVARARLPREPLSAAWSDAAVPLLERTELTLRAGEPTHACRSGAQVDLYTSLRIESSEAALVVEPGVIANLSRGGMTLQARDGWQPRAQLEATSTLGDLDLGRAAYGAWSVFQAFDWDSDRLQGGLHLLRWEDYHARYLDRPALLWCGGRVCDGYWCRLDAATPDSCPALER